MKARYVIIPSLLGLGLYQLYKNRQKISASLAKDKEHFDLVQSNLDKIHANLAIIAQQKEHLADMSQDLAYKLRVLEQESRPVLDDIQNRMAKYKKED